MRFVKHRKSTHPWLTEAVLEKVWQKQQAVNTDKEKEKLLRLAALPC